jgi:hypothetical protein
MGVLPKSVIVLLLVATSVLLFACSQPKEIGLPNGPVWDAVQKTINLQTEPNPVKEDLIERGLYIFHTGITPSEEIHLEEIEQLVDDGIYVIDKDGYLQFGPSYTPNER